MEACCCPAVDVEERRERNPDEEARLLLKIRDLMLPQTPFYFMDGGLKLHMRHWVPAEPDHLVGTIFFIHGLFAHVNRFTEIFPMWARAGFAVLTFDLPGHGYSEGLPRAFIPDFEEVFRTFLRFVSLIMEPPGLGDEVYFGIMDAMVKRIRKLPYAFVGNSMGGMLALHVANRLQDSTSPWACRCRGLVALSPSLAFKMPPPPVTWMLLNFVVPFAPAAPVPPWVVKASKPNPRHCYKDLETAAVWDLDDAERFPGVGLSWHGGMRWGQAGAFARMSRSLDDEMRAASYPILILHDPGDVICPVAGSDRLMLLSPSNDKTLVEVPGGLHFLLANEPEFVNKVMLSWLTSHFKDGC